MYIIEVCSLQGTIHMGNKGRSLMQIIPIPCLYDNYSYMIINSASGEAVVVDPGEAHPVLVEMEKRSVYIKAVLCTHHHNDHIGGVQEFLQQLPNIDVYSYYTEEKRIGETNKLLTDGDQFSVGGLEFKAIHTPGHTGGSICYLVNGCLFTGDTVFGAGAGRLFEGTAEELYNSIYNKICKLPHQTRLFFGHEYTLTNLRFAAEIEPENVQIDARAAALRDAPDTCSVPSTLELEMATNPFFRCYQYGVADSIRAKMGKDLADGMEILREIRLLRDSFS